MAIVKMKRLRLIGMAEDREELLEQLQHAGCVELSQPDEQLDDPAWESLTRADGAALLEARAREASVVQKLQILFQLGEITSCDGRISFFFHAKVVFVPVEGVVLAEFLGVSW